MQARGSSAQAFMTSWKLRRSSSRRSCSRPAAPGPGAISPTASLPPAVQKEFRLGYAPDDRSALRGHLADKGIAVEQMAEAGLVIIGDDIPVAYDRFRDRVMFPIRDPRGRVIAFGGRALSKDVPAKYLNSPETPLFHKGNVLYNLDKARGPAHETGADHRGRRLCRRHRHAPRRTCRMAVAPLGTALTEDQLALLWRRRRSRRSASTASRRGSRRPTARSIWPCRCCKPGHSLKFALLPEGQDPDDLLKAEGPEAVKAVVEAAQPLSEMLWQRALAENDRATPERRAQFERDLRSLINQIGDEVVKKHYLADVQRAAARHCSAAGRATGAWRQGAAHGAPFAIRRTPPLQAQRQRPGTSRSRRHRQLKRLAAQPSFRNVGAGAAGAA